MDIELIFWIAVGIASLISVVILYLLAKKNSMNYVDWIEEGKRR